MRIVFISISMLIVLLVAYLHITAVWVRVIPFLLIFAWFTYIALGVFRMRAQIFLPAICSFPLTNKKNIVLTFDDGPHPDGTARILDILALHNAKAIFFCLGKKIATYPELAQRIVSEGHILANHSYAHSNFIGMYSTRKVINEIQKTEAEIERFMPSLKLYRPPFGVTNPNIAKALKVLNIQAVGWNQRSFDTVSKSPEKIIGRITRYTQNGDIVLFHDTQPVTASILADYLLLTTNKGFTFDVNAFKQK